MNALITIAVIVWAVLALDRKAKQAAGRAKKTAPGPVRPSARMRDIRDISRPLPQAEATAAAMAEAREVAPPVEPVRPAYTPPRDQAPQDDFARLSSDTAFSYGAADYEFRQETRETGPSFYDERKPEPAPVPVYGLNLRFNQSALVEGVVYSEILGNRSRGRSNRWNRYAR